MAEDMQVPFLGQIPLDPRLAQCCDEGKNFFELFPEAAPSLAYMSVVKSIYFFTLKIELIKTFNVISFILYTLIGIVDRLESLNEMS